MNLRVAKSTPPLAGECASFPAFWAASKGKFFLKEARQLTEMQPTGGGALSWAVHGSEFHCLNLFILFNSFATQRRARGVESGSLENLSSAAVVAVLRTL